MQGITTPVKKSQTFQSPNTSNNGNTFDPEMSNIIDFPQLIRDGSNESQIYNSPQKKQSQITRSPSSGSKFNLSTSMGFTDRQNTERNLQSNERQTQISLQPNISNIKRRLFDFGDSQIPVLQKEQISQVKTTGRNSESSSFPLEVCSPFNTQDTPKIDIKLISKQELGVENVPQKNKNFTKECKYCQDRDDISFMVRPCLCKGSIQYVHQSCLQKDIEKNFMSETKDRFTKELACPLCKHPFLIKTYQTFSFSQLICDGNKKDFFYQNSKLIISTSFFIALIYFVSIFPQAQQFYTFYLFLFVLGCLLCFAFMLKYASSLLNLMIKFDWKILDWNSEQIQDKGQVVNQIILIELISYFNARHHQNITQPEPKN